MTKPTVGQDDKANITAPTAPSQHHSKLHQNSTQSSVKTALKTPSEHYLNPFRTPPRTLWNFTQNTIRPPPKPPSDHHPEHHQTTIRVSDHHQELYLQTPQTPSEETARASSEPVSGVLWADAGRLVLQFFTYTASRGLGLGDQDSVLRRTRRPML